MNVTTLFLNLHTICDVGDDVTYLQMKSTTYRNRFQIKMFSTSRQFNTTGSLIKIKIILTYLTICRSFVCFKPFRKK